MCRSQYVEMNDALMQEAWVPCTALSHLNSYNVQDQPVWLRVCTANEWILWRMSNHQILIELMAVFCLLDVLVRWNSRGLGLQPLFSSIWPMMENGRTLENSARKQCLFNSVTLVPKTTHLVHFTNHSVT